MYFELIWIRIGVEISRIKGFLDQRNNYHILNEYLVPWSPLAICYAREDLTDKIARRRVDRQHVIPLSH
jgi:hypothetical protein